MGIEFERTASPPGLVISDRIEQRQLHVRTSEEVDPTRTGSERFCFPVDTACSIEPSSLVFNQRYSIHLHDANGQSLGSVEVGDSRRLDEPVRFIGLGGPIKIYCRLTAPGRIEAGIDSIRLTFPEPTPVSIGARSLHERPAGTVRTPDDPEAMMRALSTLSSALKTTSPERSWPTLRGHPPLIERGEELEIPSIVSPVETDLSIAVEPSYRDLYAVAPLSFYLGATIEPGTSPAIETPRETYELGVDDALENDVARALKRCVFLDCLVRTEGLYRDDLHERSALESALPFDLADAYDLSPSDRLAEYMRVPYDAIEPYLPRWALTSYVPSTPEGVEIIPYVVNELGLVREPRGTRVSATPSAASEAEIVRSARSPNAPTDSGERRPGRPLVEPATTDESVEHAWFGDGVPRGASKASVEAFRNQLSRTSRTETIEILIVCNDARMIDEHDLLDETYGNREELPFDVDSEFGVSTDELATLLAEGGYDFLHYIGHATPDGLRCPDGELDVRSLSTVDLGVFFLNACQSYEQGLALTRRGAFGGIVTFEDIVNEGAVESGETIARLLNLGFPLRAVLELSRETTEIGDQYLVVGDGSTDIAQAEGGTPMVVRPRERGDAFDVRLQMYPTKELGVGTTTLPNIDGIREHYLVPCTVDVERIDASALETYLTWIRSPVVDEGSIVWNDGFGTISFD